MRPRALARRACAGNTRGVTLIELLVAISVLGILASVAMPLAQTTATRTRELELRRNLRKIRESLDQFKAEYDKAKANAGDARQEFKKKVSMDRSGYPLTLEEMVETKTLRRVPYDPMTADGKWVIRSFSDNPESSLSDGKDVYDIRSASKAVALDGTRYDTW
jgi:general secretion pathway protein G